VLAPKRPGWKISLLYEKENAGDGFGFPLHHGLQLSVCRKEKISGISGKGAERGFRKAVKAAGI